MVTAFFAVLALAALSPIVLRAQQDITGTWQGMLTPPAGPELRTVVKVAKADAGLTATLYSIDQGGAQIPAGNVTFQGSTLRFALPGIGATFEGALSSDGNTITGTVKQGDRPLPLILKRANAETAWVIPAPPVQPKPMPADADPSFEVATIKPSKPDTPGRAITVRGRTFGTLNQTVSGMMTFAYGLHPKQIMGGPEWLDNDKFDISAQPEGTGQPNDKQWRSMLGKLLASRYKLAFHKEKRELSVYALTMLKSGHKLTKNDSDPTGLPGLFFRGPGVFPVRNATMADFAGTMQAVVLDRPVVDQTSLAGRFDFILTWTPDETQFGGRGAIPPPPDSANAPPGLFTAIQEQLGLKLESTKAPVDVLVVDHVEKPSEN